MAEGEKRERTGRSDLFKVDEPNNSIPPITEVPQTPEEIRRKRLIRVASAATALITLALAILIGLHLHHRSSIESARVEAERSGRPAALEDAIHMLEGESGAGDRALLARLHATAALEGIAGHVEQASAALEGHDATGDGASDHRIARTYLALASGDAAEAANQAAGLVAAGPRAAEAARARALAFVAIGNVEQALQMAQAAVEGSESAPRHAALLALTRAWAGQEADAAGDATSLRVARLRIGWDSGTDSAALATEAEAIAALGDVTPAERAWARLVRAHVAVEAGDAGDAAAILEELDEAGPPGDERFQIYATEAWLAMNRASEARAAAARLPTGTTSVDAARRAQLTAELALAGGDAAAADAALASAGDGPRAAFLRARTAVLQERPDTARPLFESARQSPLLRVRASVALAELLLRTDDAAGARALLDPLLTDHPTHPRLAAAAALAHASAGDAEGGLAIVSTALAAHEASAALLGARGRIHLAAEAWAPALEALRAAVQADARDVSLLLDRGRAARQAGELSEAAESYSAALALEPGHTDALPALLDAQIELDQLEPARATLALIDEANLESREIDHLHARFLVESMAGEAGHQAIREARRRARHDRVLAYAAARLFMQSERWYDAIVAMNDALPPSDDTTPPDAAGSRRDVMILRMIAHARLGRGNMLDRLEEPLTAEAAEAPLSEHDQARLSCARGWAEVESNTMGRAAFWARRALGLDEHLDDALLILAYVEARQGRDPTPRLRAAIEHSPSSVEAMGFLATLGDTMDEEACGFARHYLDAAPRGEHASALRERRRELCPSE